MSLSFSAQDALIPQLILLLLVLRLCPDYYLGEAKNRTADEKVGKEEVQRAFDEHYTKGEVTGKQRKMHI